MTRGHGTMAEEASEITHRLLKRQIRKLLGEEAEIPPAWRRLLRAVNETYEQHDADRKLLQRSMDISSEELIEANDRLFRELEKQALVLKQLNDSIRTLELDDFDHDLVGEDLLSVARILNEQIALRNRAEKLLREREEGLRLILESAKDYAIYTLDPDGRITTWNAGAARIQGFTAEEVLGEHFSRFYTEQDVALGLPEQLFEEAVYAGRSETQGWRVRKDGSLFWADVTLTALREESGLLKGFVKIARDITGRKQAEETLKRAKAAAEAANRAKSMFVAHMSHEIRTPLNAIIGMTSLLLDTPLSVEQRGGVETIRASGEALLAIINDILDFSKIEAGKLALDAQPFDLRRCIEETLDLFAARAAKKGVELAYLFDDGTPTHIEGDVTRVRQVLVNLVSNAVKFTERGEVVIAVRGQREGDVVRCRFAVRDTGIGIPKERRGRLFKAFSQLDPTNTRKYGGTGLGLAISKRLVEAMGGTIWVESDAEAGATFCFTLPAQAVPGAEAPPAPVLAGRRALVVDDSAAAREMLARWLRAWGMHAVTAASGEEALARCAEEGPFEVALVDAQMPEMDGSPPADRLCDAFDATPIILLTTLSTLGTMKRDGTPCRHASLAKPVKRQQLHDALVGVFAPGSAGVPPSLRSPLLEGRKLAERHPLRILLAEDNLINQQVALQLLEHLGYRVDAVANGLEVIEALERQSYDVVLMDVQMPEMDGLEAARRIRRTFAEDRQPYIVALTANAMREDRERCLAAGMDAYLSKPMRVPDLTRCLQAVASPSGDGMQPS